MKDMDINKKMNRRDALKRMGTLIAGAAIATTPLAAKVVTPKPARIKRLVFFFSATGNSLYVARQLGGDKAELRSISQEIHNENPVYEAEEIGFVCPVYCFIPPAIVQDFIARSTFKADYFFTVGTYGAHSTIFPEFVDKFAKEHGVQMNNISTIQMVDTYLPYFDAEKEKADPKNQRVPERIAAVLASINSRENYIQAVTQEDRMICEGYYRHSITATLAGIVKDLRSPVPRKLSFRRMHVLDAVSVPPSVRMVLGRSSTKRVFLKAIARTVWPAFITARRKPFPSSPRLQSLKSRTAMPAIATPT